MCAWMQVCVYVGMYVCIYVCMCVYVCMPECRYVCVPFVVYACMYVCMYICMSVCVCVCLQDCVCKRGVFPLPSPPLPSPPLHPAVCTLRKSSQFDSGPETGKCAPAYGTDIPATQFVRCPTLTPPCPALFSLVIFLPQATVRNRFRILLLLLGTRVLPLELRLLVLLRSICARLSPAGLAFLLRGLLRHACVAADPRRGPGACATNGNFGNASPARTMCSILF